MIISPKNKRLPTPSNIRLMSKLFIRFASLAGVIFSVIPMSETWKTITGATVSALVGGVNDVQDWFGVNIEGGKPVQAKDVGEIHDEAIKTVVKITIFFALVNSYLYFF